MLGQKACPQCALIADQIDSFCLSLKELEDQLSSAPKQSDLDNLEIDYQKKIDVLVAEKGALEEQLASVKADLQSREEDFLGLMDKIAVLKRSERAVEEKFEAEIHALQSEITSLSSKLEQSQTQYANAGDKLSELTAEMEFLKNERGSLQSQLESLKVTTADSATLIPSLKSQISNYEQHLSTLKEEKTKLETELATMTTETEKLQSQAADVSNESENLRTKLTSLQLMVKDLEEKLIEEKIAGRDLKAELDLLKQQKDGQLAQVPGFENQIKDLEKTLQDKVDMIKRLEGDVALKEADSQKLADFWKDQLSSLQEDHQGEMVKLTSELNRMKSESSRAEMLETQHNILKADMEALKSNKIVIEEMLERSRSQKQELTDKIDQLEMMLAKKDDEIRDAAKQAITQDNSNEVLLRIELEKTRETFKKEKRMLQLRISELEDEIESNSS